MKMEIQSMAPWPATWHGQPETLPRGRCPAQQADQDHCPPPEREISMPTPPENDYMDDMRKVEPGAGVSANTMPGLQPSPQIWNSQRFSTCSLDFAEGLDWNDRKESIIRCPYQYIASRPGKEFRTVALNAFNAWLEVPPHSLSIITEVVRMLHTASLLIDDIQDNSALRRGRPVAHRVYGIAQTINAANYYYFLALQELHKLDNQDEALEIYRSEMLRLHKGQGMELYWRDTLTCPTENEYLEMISNKTGGLFRLAIRLMQSQSPTQPPSPSLNPLVQLLGLIFQIVDDYKNLSGVDYSQLKGVCEDLTEGKFSFPIIHSLRANPANQHLLSILAQKTTDVDLKMEAVEYIKGTGSLEYTKEVVRVLIQRAKGVADEVDRGRGKSYGVYLLLDKLALE